MNKAEEKNTISLDEIVSMSIIQGKPLTKEQLLFSISQWDDPNIDFAAQEISERELKVLDQMIEISDLEQENKELKSAIKTEKRLRIADVAYINELAKENKELKEERDDWELIAGENELKRQKLQTENKELREVLGKVSWLADRGEMIDIHLRKKIESIKQKS